VKKALLSILFLSLALVAVVAPSSRGSATQNPCGIPDQRPLWIDFGDGSVPFWSRIFKRPGLVIAATGLIVTPKYREAGVPLVYFDLHLNNRVGTPSAPADPALLEGRADALVKRAFDSTGCDRPFIALNELFGAQLPTPWTPTTAQYRANVLIFLKALAARGARPFLLLSARPYTGGEAGDWWRQAAQYADLVPEVYFTGPSLAQLGPIAGNRRIRTSLRSRVRDLLELGIPPTRIGVMLGFQTTPGTGGREGLKPAAKWFEVVKWQALSAKQVGSEIPLVSIWSWGWGTLNPAGTDPDKEAAACVYLWSRDQSLCDAPSIAGADFNTSLTDGQLILPPGTICTFGSLRIQAQAIAALERVTGDRNAATTALLERAVESEQVPISTAELLAAERYVIATRFAGSRAAYVSALARANASVAVARGVLFDELRRLRLRSRFRPAAPSAAAIAAYYRTYRDAQAREVVAAAPARWLGGRSHGVALQDLAPPRVFTLAPGARATVRGLEGTYRIRAIGETLPLGAFPIDLARPAIAQALVEQAQEDALHLWLVNRMTFALARATCAGDDLPEIANVDLVSSLPFLALP
jgi:hypothetical protein